MGKYENYIYGGAEIHKAENAKKPVLVLPLGGDMIQVATFSNEKAADVFEGWLYAYARCVIDEYIMYGRKP